MFKIPMTVSNRRARAKKHGTKIPKKIEERERDEVLGQTTTHERGLPRRQRRTPNIVRCMGQGWAHRNSFQHSVLAQPLQRVHQVLVGDFQKVQAKLQIRAIGTQRHYLQKNVWNQTRMREYAPVGRGGGSRGGVEMEISWTVSSHSRSNESTTYWSVTPQGTDKALDPDEQNRAPSPLHRMG